MQKKIIGKFEGPRAKPIIVTADMKAMKKTLKTKKVSQQLLRVRLW